MDLASAVERVEQIVATRVDPPLFTSPTAKPPRSTASGMKGASSRNGFSRRRSSGIHSPATSVREATST